MRESRNHHGRSQPTSDPCVPVIHVKEEEEELLEEAKEASKIQPKKSVTYGIQSTAKYMLGGKVKETSSFDVLCGGLSVRAEEGAKLADPTK